MNRVISTCHKPLYLTCHICEIGMIKILKSIPLRIELGDVYKSAVNILVIFTFILLVVVNASLLVLASAG